MPAATRMRAVADSFIIGLLWFFGSIACEATRRRMVACRRPLNAGLLLRLYRWSSWVHLRCDWRRFGPCVIVASPSRAACAPCGPRLGDVGREVGVLVVVGK